MIRTGSSQKIYANIIPASPKFSVFAKKYASGINIINWKIVKIVLKCILLTPFKNIEYGVKNMNTSELAANDTDKLKGT